MPSLRTECYGVTGLQHKTVQNTEYLEIFWSYPDVPVKLNLSYINVTKVTTYPWMPFSQIECYDVTGLQPIRLPKTRKNMFTF